MEPTQQPLISPQQSINSYNKAHLIVIGFAILAVVACVSYVLGMMSQKSSDMAVNPYLKEIATPIPTKVVATPTPDPTANWQTYTNQKYGFSAKYPPSLNAIEEAPNYVRFTTDKPNSNLPNSESYISIRVVDNPNNLSLNDYMKTNQNLQDFSTTVVDGIPAYKSSNGAFMYLENKQVIYQIALITMSGDNGLSTIFNQMIPTLQFTISQ